MMDATIKAKWVKALRSGAYQQGEHMLKTPDGDYCCLGVLRHLIEGDFDSNEDETFLNERHGLPGIKVQEHLANLNDGTGAWYERFTFAEIADYIDANL